jgi:hypothetical protein
MKRMMRTVGTILWVVLVLFSGASSAGTIQDYAKFDRAFIPPLAITQQEKVQPSKKAVEILLKAWGELKGIYYNAPTSDEALRKDFDKIEALILKSKEIVGSEQNLMSAHTTLESVRYMLMELRLRNNISYYPDLLTRFHEHMEAIYHDGADATPEKLDEDHIYALNSALEEGLQVWEAVKKAPFDPTAYGFSDEQNRTREKLIVEETAALNRLKSAIDNKDKPGIVAAAEGIKPKYAALYKLFGDFEKVMSK